jgi:hypothetical protein
MLPKDREIGGYLIEKDEMGRSSKLIGGVIFKLSQNDVAIDIGFNCDGGGAC